MIKRNKKEQESRQKPQILLFSFVISHKETILPHGISPYGLSILTTGFIRMTPGLVPMLV